MTKKRTVKTLEELTGQESGIVVYQNEGILCNWSSVDGLPRMFVTGIIGLGEDIPKVKGKHVKDLGPYLDGVEISAVVYDYKEEDHPLNGGTVYDLGDDVLVIAPDGWI